MRVKKETVGVLLMLILLMALVGCGGGGGGGGDDSGGDDDNDSAEVAATLIDDDNVFDSDNSEEILETESSDDGTTTLVLSSDSSIEDTLETGSVITVLAGEDDRFPFGLSAKVGSIATNDDGTKSATLESATLADVLSETTYSQKAIALNADNFIGVLTPESLRSGTTSATSLKALSSEDISVLNGGIILRNGTRISDTAKTTVSASEVETADEIIINERITLADMNITPSRMKPYGGEDEAAFELTGSIKNLTLNTDIEFNATSGLKSIDFGVTGDVELEAKFTGDCDAVLGYYSQAWREVEEDQIEVLGISGDISGLSGKDKVGKFPVAGLVFAVACPATGCPIFSGQTQTPLRTAKPGGVILWVYLDAKGELSLEGDLGARVNSANFVLGVTKAEGGSLTVVNEFTNNGTGRLIEAPFLDGSLSVGCSMGFSIDVDFFFGGIRVANSSLDVVGSWDLDADGEISYGTDELGSPWGWEGEACVSYTLGAGMILAASVKAGVEVEAALFHFDAEYNYSGQWPTDEEMEIAGWHGIGNITWYTSDPVELGCDNGVSPRVAEGSDIYSSALISPNGGEEWNDGDSQTVSWATGDITGSTVDLYVLHDDPSGLFDAEDADLGAVINSKLWYKFASAVSNSGSYDLDPSIMKGDGSLYVVLVVSTEDNSRFDISDATFSLNNE